MSTKFFGEYLVEKKVITEAMLEEAIRYEQWISRPYIALAMKKGILTNEQINALDAEFAAPPSPSVQVQIKGENVVFSRPKESSADLTTKSLVLGEALVQKGHLTLAQLKQFLEDYRTNAFDPDRQFWLHQYIRERTLQSIPHPDIVSIMLQITIDSFVNHIKLLVNPTVIRTGVDARLTSEHVFSQEISGDRKFHYALGLSDAFVRVVASRLLECDCTEIDDMALDAVAEFVNIVVGEACRRFSTKNIMLKAEPPVVATQEVMRTFISQNCLSAEMKTDIGSFYVILFFERQSPLALKVKNSG